MAFLLDWPPPSSKKSFLLFILRFAPFLQEFKPSDFVNNKTKIAQLSTVKREKQVRKNAFEIPTFVPPFVSLIYLPRPLAHPH